MPSFSPTSTVYSDCSPLDHASSPVSTKLYCALQRLQCIYSSTTDDEAVHMQLISSTSSNTLSRFLRVGPKLLKGGGAALLRLSSSRRSTRSRSTCNCHSAASAASAAHLPQRPFKRLVIFANAQKQKLWNVMKCFLTIQGVSSILKWYLLFVEIGFDIQLKSCFLANPNTKNK